MAKEQQTNKASEELAKWFMDLAKFIITGLVISPIFGGFEDKWLMVTYSAVLAVSFLLTGQIMLRNQSKKTTKKRK